MQDCILRATHPPNGYSLILKNKLSLLIEQN